MENSTCAKAPEKKEFEIIIDSLRGQLNRLDECSSEILSGLCMISDFRSPQKESREDAPRRDGILGEFEGLLDRLDYYNNRLDEARIGLNRFV